MMASLDRMMVSPLSMKRTQIQFDEERLGALRTLAAREGKSVSAVVREAVDALLARSPGGAEPELWRRAGAVTGSFSSEHSDVAREHDRYLADAIGSE